MLFCFTTFVNKDRRVSNNKHDRIRARKNGRTVNQKKGIPGLATFLDIVHSATSSVHLPFCCDGSSRENCECALRR